MRAFRRSPRSLASALSVLQDDLAPATTLARVQGVWAQVVGPAIAAEAAPTAERAGALTVTCTGSVWAQELDLMSPAILERLNLRLGADAITRLRCVTA